MVDFILEWKDIIVYAFLVILAIVQVLLVLFKKPIKVVDDIREIILEIVPKAINYVEEDNSLINSDLKLRRCIYYVLCYLIDIKGYSEEVVNQYQPFIENAIELVLTTPQKKEGGK